MSFLQPQTVLLSGVLAFIAAIPQAQAQRMGRDTLDPKTYKSRSADVGWRRLGAFHGLVAAGPCHPHRIF